MDTDVVGTENLKCLFQMVCPQPKDQRLTQTNKSFIKIIGILAPLVII